MSDFAGLVADAQAIPSAAFRRARCVTEATADVVIDLTLPAQRTAMRIPSATLSLVEAAGEHFATLSR